MSLKDTIEAARKEAQEAGGLFSGKAKDEEAEEEQSSGFSKRSAARAKPTSEAAASVRVVTAEDVKAGRSGKKASEMTKEERKAERSSQRDAEDRRNTVANILLKRDEYYSHTQRGWWVLLGTGLALTLISFGINYFLGDDETAAAWYYVVAIASLVGAYGCIIAAFVYDFRKARPIRKTVDAEVRGMGVKKLEQIIREDAEEAAEKKASKK